MVGAALARAGLALDRTRAETIGNAATFMFDPSHIAFAREPGWQDTFDDLRVRPRKRGERLNEWRRKAPIRAIAFEPPDARDETNPIPISTCQPDDCSVYTSRGRFGAHNIHENTPRPTCWHSDQIVIGTFFNGGVRAYDTSNPYRPKEVGAFVPEAPAPSGIVQLNDVFSTSGRSSTPSIACAAGSTRWT